MVLIVVFQLIIQIERAVNVGIDVESNLNRVVNKPEQHKTSSIPDMFALDLIH